MTVAKCAKRCQYKGKLSEVREGLEWEVCDSCGFLHRKPEKPGKPARYLPPA